MNRLQIVLVPIIFGTLSFSCAAPPARSSDHWIKGNTSYTSFTSLGRQADERASDKLIGELWQQACSIDSAKKCRTMDDYTIVVQLFPDKRAVLFRVKAAIPYDKADLHSAYFECNGVGSCELQEYS